MAVDERRLHPGRPRLAYDGAGVYAAGDCTGVLMLASVAAMQGRIAMWHALGEAVAPLRLGTVAANVFTDPEIATVGVDADSRSSRRRHAPRRSQLPLATNARAKMQGITDGFVKLFCRPGSGTVLGGVVVAPRASELILPVSLAVQHGLTVDQLAHTFSIYPSLSGSHHRGRPPAHAPRGLTPYVLARGPTSGSEEGRRWGSVLDLAEGGAGCDDLADGGGQAGDGAGLVRVERLLHLHRLEHDDEVAGLDLRAVLDGDLDDGALHRRGEGVAGRRPRRPCRRPCACAGPSCAGRGAAAAAEARRAA